MKLLLPIIGTVVVLWCSLTVHAVAAEEAKTPTDVAADTPTSTTDAPTSTTGETIPKPDQAITEKVGIPTDRMPRLTVTVEPAEGMIGDELVWRVRVDENASDTRVVLPRTLSFGSLTVVRRTSDASEGQGTQLLEIGLISFRTGEFEIPSQTLTLVDAEGRISEVRTEPFTVRIHSLLANEPEPALKLDVGEGEIVVQDDYTLLYVAGVLLAILCIILLTLLVRKLWSLRRPRPEPPPPPPRPAEDVAREKLNAIAKSTWLKEGQHKRFHLKLSEAVREYLGNRYDFDSLERSTTELIDELQQQHLAADLFHRLCHLLEDTDLVKFARFELSTEASLALLEEAFRLVEMTTEEARHHLSETVESEEAPHA